MSEFQIQISELFSAAYGKAATVQNGTSGFRKAGIYPFRRDVFTDENFMCSQMTERVLSSDPMTSGSASVNCDTATQSVARESHGTSGSNAKPAVTTTIVPVAEEQCSSASTSTAAELQTVSVHSPAGIAVDDQSDSAIKTFSEILNSSIDQSPCIRTSRKKCTAAQTAIVTSSPCKLNLVAQKNATEKRVGIGLRWKRSQSDNPSEQPPQRKRNASLQQK